MRRSPLIALAGALVCWAAPNASAQWVYGDSQIYEADATYGVLTYSLTEGDYVASYYYAMESDVFFSVNGVNQGELSQCCEGDQTDAWAEVSGQYLGYAASTDYQVQTNHWVITRYNVGSSWLDQYGFSNLLPGNTTGNDAINPPLITVDVVNAFIYLGSTYDGFVTPPPGCSRVAACGGEPPPIIAGIQPNGMTGDTVYNGATGYISIYGQYLDGNPSVNVDGKGVHVTGLQYASATQINAWYQVDSNALAVNHKLTVSTNHGVSNPATLVVSGVPVYSIVMREFIRGNYILGPLPCSLKATYFRGDSRNFMANPPMETPLSNPYRAMQAAVLQPETSAAPNGVGGPLISLPGTSRQYDAGSLISGPDPAGSGKIINPAIPDTVVSCNGGANLIGLKIDSPPAVPGLPGRSNPHTVNLFLAGQSLNPLTPPGTPPISWNIYVAVDHTNPNAVKVSASGTHTCYPANEIWVTSSANPLSPYYVWEYGPGGPTPNAAYDESITYLTKCLSGINPPIVVNGSTILPR